MPAAHLPSIPSVAQYTVALSAIRAWLSDGQLAMLRTQYRASERTLTASELATAAQYRSYRGTNLQYGRMGVLLRDALGYWGDGSAASYVLSGFIPPGVAGNSEWLFVMHDEVAQALTELGWFDHWEHDEGQEQASDSST
jgi:hypothetical protein